eukprot:TRINITY_DN7452_c0_g1_i1.p1 TRINITY_DN7452_c0_g1~~TRINITY_DN7452_c0_g1_i1.p1  ORF type:complete len:387 (-),score=64.47 TRINITY_DN7452_c0_g1_i1:26-1186(-)
MSSVYAIVREEDANTDQTKKSNDGSDWNQSDTQLLIQLVEGKDDIQSIDWEHISFSLGQRHSAKQCNDWHSFLTRIIDKRVEDEIESRLENESLRSSKKKRIRRKAVNISRTFRCSALGCQKAYGSEAALKHHFRMKHPGLPYQKPSSNNSPSEKNIKNKSKYYRDLTPPLSNSTVETLAKSNSEPEVQAPVLSPVTPLAHLLTPLQSPSPWLLPSPTPPLPPDPILPNPKKREHPKNDSEYTESENPRKRERTSLLSPGSFNVTDTVSASTSADDDLTVSSYANPSPYVSSLMMQNHFSPFSPPITPVANIRSPGVLHVPIASTPNVITTMKDENSSSNAERPNSPLTTGIREISAVGKSPKMRSEDPYRDYSHHALPWQSIQKD